MTIGYVQDLPNLVSYWLPLNIIQPTCDEP